MRWLLLLLWPLWLDADLRYEFERLYLRAAVAVVAPARPTPTPAPTVVPPVVPAPSAPSGYVSPVGHLSVSGWTFDPPRHPGVDLACNHGAPIRSMAAGVIVASGWTDDGCGFNVTVDHGGGLRSRYCHLDRITASGRVRAGWQIGTCGSTGWSGGYHLHLEVWRWDAPVDPLSLLR